MKGTVTVASCVFWALGRTTREMAGGHVEREGGRQFFDVVRQLGAMKLWFSTQL